MNMNNKFTTQVMNKYDQELEDIAKTKAEVILISFYLGLGYIRMRRLIWFTLHANHLYLKLESK